MRKIILILILLKTITTYSQIHEIGVTIGGANYIGDVGRESYIHPNQPMLGFFYKWNMNTRIALRGTFTYGKIKANDLEATSTLRKQRGLKFTNTIKELALGMEFNFLTFDVDNITHFHTPYLLLEAAAFNYNTVKNKTANGKYQYENKTSYAIPFGVGYKTRVTHNFIIALELRGRYTFKDDLDYNHKEIQSLKFGNPKSNDWYMFTGINIIYTFGRPPCYATPY